MPLENLNALILISILSHFLASIVGLSTLKNNRSFNKVLLITYLIVGGCNETLTLFLASKNISTQLYVSVFMFFEFVLITYVFFSMLKSKALLLGSIMIVLPFMVYETYYFDAWKMNYVVSRFTIFFILILICLLQFRNMLVNYSGVRLTNLFDFWFSAGVLTFFSGNLMFAYFLSFIALENQSLLWLIIIQIVGNIIYNVFLTLALVKPHYES